MEKQRRRKRLKSLWIPKILSILYILFISLFSLDTPFGIGFLIHMIPSFIFTGCLVVAWFKQKIGGILFILAGIVTIIAFNTYEQALSLLTISVIPVIIGILFLLIKKN